MVWIVHHITKMTVFNCVLCFIMSSVKLRSRDIFGQWEGPWGRSAQSEAPPTGLLAPPVALTEPGALPLTSVSIAMLSSNQFKCLVLV